MHKRFHIPVFIALLVYALTTTVSVSLAADRIALIIGNGGYAHGGALANRSNDATAVSNAFRRLGFGVIRGLDLSKADIDAYLVAPTMSCSRRRCAPWLVSRSPLKPPTCGVGGIHSVNPLVYIDITRQLMRLTGRINQGSFHSNHVSFHRYVVKREVSQMIDVFDCYVDVKIILTGNQIYTRDFWQGE